VFKIILLHLPVSSFLTKKKDQTGYWEKVFLTNCKSSFQSIIKIFLSLLFDVWFDQKTVFFVFWKQLSAGLIISQQRRE
jgi:hypothetical protein